MNKVILPGMPARAQDYEQNGKFCRAIYKPKETNQDRVTIACQAFEVDAEGRLVASATGEPSRTHGTEHTINTTSLGTTHSLKAAWVRQQIDANEDLANEQGVPTASQLPEAASVGDRVYVEPFFYIWTQGWVLDVMDAKAGELFKLLGNSTQLIDISL